MTYAVGSLVRARGREWVVLPDSTEDFLIVRPLDGADLEITGIAPPELAEVESATFTPPDPGFLGDHRSCWLLRDAVRIRSRAGAGPFRSFSRIGFEPRPYQLVPLMMALRQDPTRLLIADDVGIGKTIEAGLIARELLDRGEISRFTVLAPSHLLAEQWQRELAQKFHLEAELVLPSTVARLERTLHSTESIFDRYPFTIVSIDYIKRDRYRTDFLHRCPELVIVDEAHSCAFGGERRGGRHQRYELLQGLAAKEDRHLLLVTATPHSGKDDAFRSLIGLLHSDLGELPEDLGGDPNRAKREQLAQFLVQRRRGDVLDYVGTTVFPEREEKELTYLLGDYRVLLDQALAHARAVVQDEEGGSRAQRIRWWSALALLRSISSSPQAAIDTLTKRAPDADWGDGEDDIDAAGERFVLDGDDETAADETDVAGWSDVAEPDSAVKRRLRNLRKLAEGLVGDKDPKVQTLIPELRSLLDEGHRPIVFCRYIPTANYVTEQLRKAYGDSVRVECVTGELPPKAREERILALVGAKQEDTDADAPEADPPPTDDRPYVLVCTDCLSEGINLQTHFDSVVHYDLAWSPTRHEQREGRVDRYGQSCEKVRVLTYYGADNPIDGIVWNVLIDKHRRIRSSTGVSIPMPVASSDIAKTIYEGILFRSSESSEDLLPGMEEFLQEETVRVHQEWEHAAEREKRSRSLFAQHQLKPDEVAREVDASRQSIGDQSSLRSFTLDALKDLGATVSAHARREDAFTLTLGDLRRSARDAIDPRYGSRKELRVTFREPGERGELILTRTHPFITSVANHLFETALDPEGFEGGDRPAASRAGVIRTGGVDARTTLLLVRMRFDIETKFESSESESQSQVQIAEECALLAFRGSPEAAEWLDVAAAEALLSLEPDENLPTDRARPFVERVIEGQAAITPHLEQVAQDRAADLLEAHRRVRKAAEIKHRRYEVTPRTPVDLLGVYVYVPAQG